MPIARELRHFYRTPSWFALLQLLKERAKGRCEWCRKPRGPVMTRTGFEWVVEAGRKLKRRRMFWCQRGSLTWYNEQGWRLTVDEYELALSFKLRHITVRLCGAHLNHRAGDDRPENAALLCEWCHFYQDRGHHKETRSRRKDAARPVLTPWGEVFQERA